jgi:hypothetical protein
LHVTAQVFRLKAEVYKTSRKARINPFKTFPVSLPAATGVAQAGTTFGSIREESSLGKKPKRFDKFISQLKCPKFCVIAHGLSLKAFSLQSIYLSRYFHLNSPASRFK